MVIVNFPLCMIDNVLYELCWSYITFCHDRFLNIYECYICGVNYVFAKRSSHSYLCYSIGNDHVRL